MSLVHFHPSYIALNKYNPLKKIYVGSFPTGEFKKKKVNIFGHLQMKTWKQKEVKGWVLGFKEMIIKSNDAQLLIIVKFSHFFWYYSTLQILCALIWSVFYKAKEQSVPIKGQGMSVPRHSGRTQ